MQLVLLSVVKPIERVTNIMSPSQHATVILRIIQYIQLISLRIRHNMIDTVSIHNKDSFI